MVLRYRGRVARAGAHLRLHLAVRRPGGTGRGARLVHGDSGGAHPIVVIRDREGTLRGSSTSAVTARTRSPAAAAAAKRSSARTTPGRTLDGSLRKAPRSERETGFDPADFSLLPISVDTWRPFLFVNPDSDAAPLADTLGDMPAIVASSGLDLSTLTFHSHHEWPIEANWKVALENYLECYHCPTAHPGFSKVIDVDPDSYALTVSPTFSSQIGPIKASALSGKGNVPFVPIGDVKQSQYHFLWPNTTVNIAPGPANISLERWVPDGLGRTIEITDYWFGVDVPPDIVQEVLDWDDQVGQEDSDLVVSVQAGSLGRRPSGPPDARERATDRRLPGAPVRRDRLRMLRRKSVTLPSSR